MIPNCVHCGGVQEVRLISGADGLVDAYLECAFCGATGPHKIGTPAQAKKMAIDAYGPGAVVNTGKKTKRVFKTEKVAR